VSVDTERAYNGRCDGPGSVRIGENVASVSNFLGDNESLCQFYSEVVGIIQAHAPVRIHQRLVFQRKCFCNLSRRLLLEWMHKFQDSEALH
jgi:hypothetical protein